MKKRDTLLITGAAGGMGSLLMQGLGEPWKLVGVDQTPSADPRVLLGDVSRMDELDVDPDQIAVALHFAANPDESQPLPELLEPNFIACEAFLHWCASKGVPRIIYASSCEAFLGDEEAVLTTDSPYRPRNVYGCGKVFGEMLCRMLHRTHGCHTLALRLGALLPEAMHEELSGDPGYEAVRLPKEEFVNTLTRILNVSWTGSHEVFLGGEQASRLPTKASLDAFFDVHLISDIP